MNKKKLLIIGAGGHGKVCADIAFKMKRWSEIAFLDDNKDINKVLEFKIIGTTNDIVSKVGQYEFFIAIGDNLIREKIFNQLNLLNATIPKLIHPNVTIGTNVIIGKGTVVLPGVIINSDSKIGQNCILNTGCTIDHDNLIEDSVHISPGAILAGTVSIGKRTWIGVGSVISNDIKIVNDCIIGAGAVVVKNIQKSGIYIGIPAKEAGN